MATIERFITEGLSSNLGGEKAASRVFLVDLPREQVDALLSVGATIPGVPAKGENHPTIVGVYVQNHSTRDTGNGLQTEVIAQYASSNLSASQYSQPDLTGSGFVRGVNFTTEFVTIPYAVASTVTYSAGGTQETKAGWKVQTAQIPETRVIIEARWRINAPSAATIDAFDQQNNKIHEIGGRKYLFTMGGISPIDNTYSTVSAQWLSDKGTPSGPTTTDPTSYLTVDDLPLLPGQSLPSGLSRPPFAVLSTVPAPDPSQDLDDVAAQPFLLITYPYEEDLLGWHSLPSVPNL